MHHLVLNEQVGVKSLCHSHDSQEINEKGLWNSINVINCAFSW